MDDEEDVQRMIEVLNQTKQENAEEFQYEEFINCDESDIEENDEPEIIDEDYVLCDLSNTDVSKLNTYDPISSLKPDERQIIDSCFEPDLKCLLLLNRTKSMQLIQLYKKLKDTLIECQKNISDKSELLKKYKKSSKGLTNSTGAWRLGAPYFKDKKLYRAPPNADVARKIQNQELSSYELFATTKWSGFECEKLTRAVKLNYNINQQTDIVKKIKELTNTGETKNIKTVIELKARLKELKENDNSEIPPLNSNKHIDWMRVSEIFLKDKHSAFECQSFWHIYLHPHINKLAWTPEENEKLRAIVEKHSGENWDLIAKELDNNRTGFTCCLNYHSNLNAKCKKGEFTCIEDLRLIELVDRYKMGPYIPWVKIVQHFQNRTRTQLHHRWTYYLTQNDKKKGKFTEAEDVLLMIIVDKYGKCFKKCAEFLPSRSQVQCKARYNSNLTNSIKKGSFTLNEDEIIIDFVNKNGTRCWSHLTEILKRSRGQIRQRYNTIRMFLDSNPDKELRDVPRRKHNVTKGGTYEFLRLVADKYKNNPTIPSLEEIEVVLGYKKFEPALEEEKQEPKEEDILPQSLTYYNDSPAYTSYMDNLLTEFFCNSFKISTAKCTVSGYVEKAANDVEALLDLLKVDLDLPKDFDRGLNLDNLDVAILANIFEKKAPNKVVNCQKSITQLVPPNLNTVICMRSLLIKNSQHRSMEKQVLTNIFGGLKKHSNSSKIMWEISKHVMSLPPEKREQLKNDRLMFYKRFHSLLKWPALMTLEDPSIVLQSRARFGHFKEPPAVRRTYSKKPATTSVVESNVKRMKISELPSTSTSAGLLKLTPVTNKSVIENLMRDKNKKLFCFNKIQQGSQTKTIIREIKLPRAIAKENTEEQTEEIRPSITVAGKSLQDGLLDRIQSDCSMDEDNDDCDSIFNVSWDSMAEDAGDPNKLSVFLKREYDDDQCQGDNDVKDLNKLNMFLKQERDANNDSDESYSFG